MLPFGMTEKILQKKRERTDKKYMKHKNRSLLSFQIRFIANILYFFVFI